MRSWLTLGLFCFVASASAQEGTPHFHPAGEPPAIDRRGAPVELGGFRFGASVTAVRRACRRAHASFEIEDHVATCDGLARELGFPGTAQLRFCDRKLCAVRVTLDARGERDKVRFTEWGRGYREIVAALIHALGDELQTRMQADDVCWTALRERDDARCFAGDARAYHYWESGGFELSVRLARSTRRHHDAPDLVIDFRSPERLQELSRTSD